jgi:hypothetical protein
MIFLYGNFHLVCTTEFWVRVIKRADGRNEADYIEFKLQNIMACEDGNISHQAFFIFTSILLNYDESLKQSEL